MRSLGSSRSSAGERVPVRSGLRLGRGGYVIAVAIWVFCVGARSIIRTEQEGYEMSDSLSPQEQVAFPFLEAAVRIDTAKQNLSDKDLLIQVLDDNVALWLYFKNLLLGTDQEIAEETKNFLIQASEFMVKSAQLLQREVDEDLISRLVTINLNMSELLLQAPTVPTIPSSHCG